MNAPLPPKWCGVEHPHSEHQWVQTTGMYRYCPGSSTADAGLVTTPDATGRDELARMLCEQANDHPYSGASTRGVCTRHRNHADALMPWFTTRLAEAEQAGREDNADHGMCYVHGSKALAAHVAEAERRGAEKGWSEAFGAVAEWMRHEKSIVPAPTPVNPYRRAAQAQGDE